MSRAVKKLLGIPHQGNQVGRRRGLSLESLEDRRMFAGDSVEAVLEDYGTEVTDEWFASEAVWQVGAVDHAIGLFSHPPAMPGELPVLHSNLGASRTIYLNFTGNKVAEEWNTERGDLSGLVTYAFDTDGDPSQFSVNEQYMIRQIWEIVAEDYAPFDVDVTTDYAGPFGNGQALNVAIGGTDRDQLLSTGIARADGFSNFSTLPSVVVTTNVRYQMAYSAATPELKSRGLYDRDLGTSELKAQKDEIIRRYMDLVEWETMVAIGNTVSHESGHAFGLVHHENFVEGTPHTEYSVGTVTWTPIMGSNLSTDRHTWSYPDVTFQDQLEVLADDLGARTDDHPDAYATPLIAADSGLLFEQSGIITTMDDADAFSFRVQYDGIYHVAVNVPQFGNLDSRFELYSPGDLVGAGNNFDQLSETGQFLLEAGKDYLLVVKSNGVYGDLGRYTVSVTWPILETGPLAEIPLI
nr:hypothetical protein [Pirellulales bacterium]